MLQTSAVVYRCYHARVEYLYVYVCGINIVCADVRALAGIYKSVGVCYTSLSNDVWYRDMNVHFVPDQKHVYMTEYGNFFLCLFRAAPVA